ncbi:hypothetical protein EVA_00808 [gut metagenome]|uniref:Uncharacterized protein n=1 Tax=gut metagenome TaxID=749906 RepID=J9GQM0_9ZZZZ
MTDAAQFVDTRSFTQKCALLVEVSIGKLCLLARPALDSQRLECGEHTVVNILDRDTVAYVVVPYSKHTAFNGRILFLEGLVADHCGRPRVVKPFAVEVVVIVTGCGHDVNGTVGDADKLVTQLLHVLRIGVAVEPAVHEYIFSLYGCLTLGVRQGTPNNSLLAEAFYKTDVVVGKFAELLYHFLLGIGIFVGTDVYTLATEDRFLAAEVFAEEAVDKFVGLGIEEVEVVHTVLLATNLGFVLCEGE